MNIKNLLESEHSKKQALIIVDLATADPKALTDLMDCFFDKDNRLCQRAAWSVGILGQNNPEIIRPFLPKMIRALDNPRHDAVIRNTIRIFQDIDVPEELEGEVYEKCFSYLTSPKYPTAIKAFSATVLFNIAIKIPELKDELIIAIEDQITHATVGFVNRAKKLLKKLRK
jgi:hypothetical protein